MFFSPLAPLYAFPFYTDFSSCFCRGRPFNPCSLIFLSGHLRRAKAWFCLRRHFVIKASQSPRNFGTKYSGLYFRRHKLRIPCSAASVAAHFAPLCLLFPQNLAAQSFAGALKVERFCFPFYGVAFLFYGGLIVVWLFISHLQCFSFLILSRA